MADRFDKLGRRIPEFDRSAAAVKGAKTQKEKHGKDFHAKSGATGGRKRTRGYFGTLKDSGRTDEIIAAAKKGAAITSSRPKEERQRVALKGWETKHRALEAKKGRVRRPRHSVSSNSKGQA